MLNKIKNGAAQAVEKAAVIASAVAAFGVTGFAMADDPSTAIVTTLGTYATDVGLLAVAVLTIYYGKKLVSYLRV